MHRTQIMLEDSQYDALREEARRKGKSLGQLVRECVARGIESPRGKSPDATLRSLKGMFRKPRVRGRDHDRYLYGENR